MHTGTTDTGPPPIPRNHKLLPDTPLKVSQMKPVIKPTRPHSHAGYYELILLTEGAGTHTIETTSHAVQPGMAFFLQPGQVHCWDFCRIPAGYVLMFHEAWLAAHPLFQQQGLYSLRHLPQAWRLDPDQTACLDRLLCNLATLPPQADPILAGSYLYRLLAHLSSYQGQAPATGPDAHLLDRFRQAIGHTFAERRDIAWYATTLGTSRRRLNQACRSPIGRSANDLVRERIVLEAKRLLMHSELSVSSIAYDLGFHDPSHFVKFFRKHTNLTPGDYRERLASMLPVRES
ncbi:MAG: helix-turn-helix transcriptional regulator [Bacteroidia bacterium]